MTRTERVARAMREKYIANFSEKYLYPSREYEWLEEAEAALTAIDEERDALREALEPFAKAADVKLYGEWADDEHFGQTDVGFYLTFGDLRKAREALARSLSSVN